MKRRIIVIVDAGHGVDIPGKRSVNGVLREYAWNRDCAKVLMSILPSYGFEFKYVVPEETEIDVPLDERVKRINTIVSEYKPVCDGIVLVSIHCNADGMGKEWTKAHGWCIYTSRGVTKSDAIATSIFNAASEKFGRENVRKDTSDGDPDWEANFKIIYKSKCPAVLVENFFMTNKEDYEYLISPLSIYECAEVIATGLKNYYDEVAI